MELQGSPSRRFCSNSELQTNPRLARRVFAMLAKVCLDTIAIAGRWQVREQVRTTQLALRVEHQTVGLAERKAAGADQ